MKILVSIAVIIAALFLFSLVNNPGPHGQGYFNSHGCHYIKKTDFMGNHIYVCPKAKSHG